MKLIKNLIIRDKLLLLILLLLVPLVYFVFQRILQQTEDRNELEELHTSLQEAKNISSLIYEFQLERALMLVSDSSDSLATAKVHAQGVRSRSAERSLRAFYQESERSISELTDLEELEDYREQYNAGSLDKLEFRANSLKLIYGLLSELDQDAVGVNDALLSRELNAFANLTESAVYLGRIRTALLDVLATDSLTNADYAHLISLYDFHVDDLEDFARFASATELEKVEMLQAGRDYQEFLSVFRLFEKSPRDIVNTYRQQHIQQLLDANILAFQQISDALIDRIIAEVAEDVQELEQALLFVSLALIFSIGLAVLLAIYILRLISSSLHELKLAAERVKQGATDVFINIDSEDEIGEVAEAFRGVVNKNIALALVAREIGEGNFQQEVPLFGKEDELSLALQEMKDKLQRLSNESKERNWLLSGISELNRLMIGSDEIQPVIDKALAFLCRYTGAGAGILYLMHEGGKLSPEAAYGAGVSLDRVPFFRLGEGALGQAVADKGVQLLEDVPADYMKIRSGMAEIVPEHVLLLPLTFSQTTVGAVEMSSRHTLSPLQLEFLQQAAERMAILLHSLRASLHTQELLYQTQNQAEELETQQEELRQLNDELRTSEEELKVSQEELQEKNAELEEKTQLLEEQYESLENKNKDLESARQAIELKIQQVETVSKYKSDFLANMSHELRTPLNSILILSRLLTDNPEQNLNAKQREHVQIIHNSGADLLKLINEVLDLSKIEAGQVKLELEKLNPRSLSLESSFREMAQNKQIDLQVHFAEDLPQTITSDRLRLEQILRNFLANALKFTGAGGKVELSVYRVNGRQKRSFQSDILKHASGVLAFAVKDSGIGISQEKQPLIFEAFQQADTSTTRKFGGTGLGLAISKELAGLLGGEIQLDSEEGKGSTFTLYLPEEGPHQGLAEGVQDVPQVVEVAEQTPSAPSRNKSRTASSFFKKLQREAGLGAGDENPRDIRLLIVEDDRGFNSILADFAQAKRFSVQQAFSGKQGLQLARETKPHAILLDINLPDMSGWDVLQQIREDENLRHINVHVMSAYDREVIEQQNPGEEYLPKPVTLEMLNKAFHSISRDTATSIETVLIVEDNEVENKAIGELLQAHGIKSVSAHSAEEAEQLLNRKKVDCIVLDLNLPGMKGYEWMEQLRAKQAWAELPIIVYSGKQLDEEEENRLKRYANTIIIKNAYSYLRLLDEVQLFLHSVNQKLPAGKDFKMKPHLPEEVLRNKKILLVDDDVRNVYSLSSLLELQQMEVVVAYNGKEALEKLKAEADVDLVLMDVMMPEMDGITATREIRKMYEYRNLPIIALTAKAMKGDKEKCIDAGASDYITKPVDTDKLLTLMRVWLYEA